MHTCPLNATCTSPVFVLLTGIAIVEFIIVLMCTVGSIFIPLLGICVVVILHQYSKKNNENDLQDDAQQRQSQPHVSRVGHDDSLSSFLCSPSVPFTLLERGTASDGSGGAECKRTSADTVFLLLVQLPDELVYAHLLSGLLIRSSSWLRPHLFWLIRCAKTMFVKLRPLECSNNLTKQLI